MVFTFVVSFALFYLSRTGKEFARRGTRRRKDDKTVGLELSATGMAVYLTIVGVYPNLIPIFWNTSTLTQFKNYIIILILLAQFFLWLRVISYTNLLLKTHWDNKKGIRNYTWVTNLLGLFSVCICFLMIFFGRILP